jgi:anoctamin-10
MAPYIPYTTSDKLQDKWRFYEINELKNRDIFRSMDRIKILFSMITQSMNIFRLSHPKLELIESFGALHDIYQLDKISKLPLFSELPKATQGTDVPDYLEKILKFMSTLSDEAEDRDFIDISTKQDTEFSLFSPMELDIDPIQNYFGEKIALYFTYLQNFTASLKSFGYFGVLMFIVDEYLLYKGNQGLTFPAPNSLDPEVPNPIIISKYMEWYHYFRMIFTLFIVIWTSIFLEHWKRKQKNFAIKFGQLDFKE